MSIIDRFGTAVHCCVDYAVSIYISYSLISSVMSFDGTEIAFLVSTSSTCPTSTYGNGTDGAITGTNKISYHIVSLHIENLQVMANVCF